MDLVVCNTNDFAGIYKNNSETNGNNYLKIKLKGTPKNTNGTGAKVTVYCKENKYYQEQFAVRGFQSSVDPVLNFGLGKFAEADSIVIIWPDNAMQVLRNVKSNQTITPDIKQATGAWVYDTIVKPTYFIKSSSSFFTHRENNFNDFTVQSLLLSYMSRQGPSLAKADINKDGLEDVFVGGAKGQASEIFFQQPDGNFKNTLQPALAADAASEDVASSFFDADGDGDEDLYVGSGGYEFEENDPAFQDRLYINDGKGNFSKSEKALPSLLFSKSCVKPTDIDGDGDIDLFVGGRLIPGK